MKHITRLLFLMLLAGCQNGGELLITPREYLGPVCGTCPSIRVYVPEASEERALGRVVNQGVREEVIQWLDYDDQTEASDIPEAIAEFGKAYETLNQQFPDELIGWEATIEGYLTYENSRLLSLRLQGYIFTGGAHGYQSVRYLNFDKERALELDNSDLFSDWSGLEAVAERAFRKAHQIPEGSDINSTGFMFEDNQFSLPESIGFEAEGLVLHYNPYEIASYADGPIRLVLPYADVAPFLAFPIDVPVPA